MYCKFYGLKEKPFSVTADPSFFFASPKHKEALYHLSYGVNHKKGIIVITGEIGTGKTTLCKFFLNQLKSNIRTAIVLNPYLPQIQLLEAIVKDFGLAPRDKSVISLIWDLNKFLLREAGHGNNVVLIIDEAQNLKPHQLEQIRLLSNLETEKDKLIQIVLVGQPELNKKLELYELRQLQQRIMVRYHITPLNSTDVQEYIKHRLLIAGAADKIRFTDEAISQIAYFSEGIPRLINAVADRALLAGFVMETNTLDADIINKCILELGSSKKFSMDMD